MDTPVQGLSLSIILPVMNEAECIASALSRLQHLRRQGAELIVVDGGSHDHTVRLATPLADSVIISACGRAVQMNAGAAAASNDILLFLHADTALPDEAAHAIAAATESGAHWGRFDVEITGKLRMLRVVAFLMNLRSRISGVATGDQGIFVRRTHFEQLGGYPPIQLMEDLALSDLLKSRSSPACLRQKVKTSGRRWEKYGLWRTIFLMWRLRAAFRLGVSTETLARQYRS